MRDISQPLHAAVPVWPGEPPFALHSHAVIGDGCPVNVGAMFTPLHAGTHGDAPLHYANDGVSSADSDLDPYIGPCVLLDVRHARGRVEVDDIDWDAVAGATRVLLRTYEQFPHDQWDSDLPAIASGVIPRLGAMGVRLIGTDADSLDPEQSNTHAPTALQRTSEGKGGMGRV